MMPKLDWKVFFVAFALSLFVGVLLSSHSGAHDYCLPMEPDLPTCPGPWHDCVELDAIDEEHEWYPDLVPDSEKVTTHFEPSKGRISGGSHE